MEIVDELYFNNGIAILAKHENECYSETHVMHSPELGIDVALSISHGCTLGCSHCQASRIPFRGNFTTEEILRQANTSLGKYEKEFGTVAGHTRFGYAIMGEPSLNPRAVIKSIEQLSKRKCVSFLVSTRAISRELLYDLAGIKNTGVHIKLQFSLVSFDDQERKKSLGRCLSCEEIKDFIENIWQDTTYLHFVGSERPWGFVRRGVFDTESKYKKEMFRFFPKHVKFTSERRVGGLLYFVFDKDDSSELEPIRDHCRNQKDIEKHVDKSLRCISASSSSYGDKRSISSCELGSFKPRNYRCSRARKNCKDMELV